MKNEMKPKYKLLQKVWVVIKEKECVEKCRECGAEVYKEESLPKQLFVSGIRIGFNGWEYHLGYLPKPKSEDELLEWLWHEQGYGTFDEEDVFRTKADAVKTIKEAGK